MSITVLALSGTFMRLIDEKTEGRKSCDIVPLTNVFDKKLPNKTKYKTTQQIYNSAS
jgi:hypothetical protein